MKILNAVLLSGILVALVVIVLQNAGLVLQPPPTADGAPVELTPDGRDKRLAGLEMIIAGQQLEHAHLKVISAQLTEALDGDGFRVTVENTPSVNLAKLAEMPLHWNEKMNRIGIRERTPEGETLIRPIVWGEFTIDQLHTDPIRVEVEQDPGTGIHVNLRGIGDAKIGFGKEGRLGVVEAEGEFLNPIQWGEIGISKWMIPEKPQ